LSRAARLGAALVVGALAAGTASAVVWRADKPAENAFALVRHAAAVGRVDRGGSATLIARDWALTAAHVAQGLTESNRIRWGDRDHAVKRVVIHPQGAPDPAQPRRPPEVDLALVQLAEPVVGISPLMPNRATDELGKMLMLPGYGDFGPAGGPLQPSDGALRAVENQVDDAGPLRLFLRFDAPPGGLPLEGIGAAGDSGGPAIEVGSHFGDRLVGVSSGADGPPGQYGTVDVYTRVSAHIGWIEEVAGPFRDVGFVKRVEPSWPRKAMIKGIQGAVVVDATVGVDGVPTDIVVVASKPAGTFDDAVLAAFAKWRFTPRIEAGVPVASRVRQRLDFELKRH
jgi:TonB family protein